jgi:hypothetical protein
LLLVVSIDRDLCASVIGSLTADGGRVAAADAGGLGGREEQPEVDRAFALSAHLLHV